MRRLLGLALRAFPLERRGGLITLLLQYVAKAPSHAFRLWAYRLVGMTIGERAHIYGGLEVREPDRVEIGGASIVGHNVILDGRSGIKIGKNVNISSEAAIWTLQHDPQSPSFGTTGGQVVVDDRAWLSFRCTVLPGVHIGEGAVVAAGSIVTKDVEPFTIVAGIPARKIGVRTRDLDYDLAADGHLAFV